MSDVQASTGGPRGAPRGSPRGGPPRGGPRGAPRGGPRGGPPRGGPRGAPRGGFRGAPPRGRGSSNVAALGLDSHAKLQSQSSPILNHSNTSESVNVEEPAPKVVENVVVSASGKRHSKIQMTGVTPLSTRGLDVEGLDSSKKKSDITVSASPSPGGIGARWANQMAQQAEDDFQKNRDKLRGRRKGGVEFMDKQIRQLIDEIKRLSGGSGGGLGAVTFGVLFDATADTFPALSATLNVAKKRGVVSFEGDMLMQGTHSHVKITLIKDEIEDSSDFQSVIGIRPIKVPTADPVFATSMCAVCSKTVYPMDRVSANDRVMHKTCFKCSECKCSLKLGNFAFNSGKFYCETHFQQKFKSGAGYDF